MKRNLFHALASLSLILFFPYVICAEVKLPAIFGNFMVLQQQSDAALWGKAAAVRYAFDDFVTGELYNTEGLPASSFRTDNWEK